MKKLYFLPLFSIILAVTSFLFLSGCGNKNEKEFETEENDEYDGPDQAILFEIERTKDPATGRVPWDKLLLAKQQTEQARNSSNLINALSWLERGPDGDFYGPQGNT